MRETEENGGTEEDAGGDEVAESREQPLLPCRVERLVQTGSAVSVLRLILADQAWSVGSVTTLRGAVPGPWAGVEQPPAGRGWV